MVICYIVLNAKSSVIGYVTVAVLVKQSKVLILVLQYFLKCVSVLIILLDSINIDIANNF